MNPTLTPERVKEINDAREANVNAGVSAYSGAGATPFSASQGLGNVITSDVLSNSQSPVTIPPVQSSTLADGITGASQAAVEQARTQQKLERDKAEKEAVVKDDRGALIRIKEKFLGLQQSQSQLEKDAGLDEKNLKVAEYTNSLEASQRAQTNELRALNGIGLTDVQKNQSAREINRQYAFEQADLQILLNGSQRNFDAAQANIDRKIKLQLEPLQTELEFTKLFYEENKDALSKSDDRAFQNKITQDKQRYDAELATRTAIGNLQLEAIKNGVTIPASVLARLNTAKDTAEATSILAQAGISLQDPLDRRIKEASLAEKYQNIQESKIKAEQLARALSPAIQTKVQSIAGQFDSEQAVKNYQSSAESIDAVKSAGVSPIDDIQRVYAVAKVFDPSSAVKEGEYKTVQDYATALLQRSGLKAKRVFSNTGFLTDEARTFIEEGLSNRLKSSKKAYDNIYSEYGRRINKITKSGDGTEYLTDYSRAFSEDSNGKIIIAPDGQEVIITD